MARLRSPLWQCYSYSCTSLPVLLALFGTLGTQYTNALDNGVGRTPALGWSTWNYFVRLA